MNFKDLNTEQLKNFMKYLMSNNVILSDERVGVFMITLTIAVDFDGTVVKHKYPEVGADVPFAVDILRGLVNDGHSIILWTMRSGKELEDAVKWFEDRKITLFGIQSNPTQSGWTSSPKAYAEAYIDDAAVGCPLIYSYDSRRPYVDWLKVQDLLNNIIRKRIIGGYWG